MQCDLRDLTRGPIKKQIFFFSLPLILSNLLQVLFNMADVAVVGRFAGSLALAVKLAEQRVSLLRVHDVAMTRAALAAAGKMEAAL